MSEARYWVSKNGGTPEGPYWPGKLIELYEAGKFAPEDQVCPTDTESWSPIADTVEFLRWNKPASLTVLRPLQSVEPQYYSKRKVRTETTTAGVVLIVVGLCFTACIVGIPFFIWGFCIVSRSIYACGKCGNEVDASAGVCPICGAALLNAGQAMPEIIKLSSARSKKGLTDEQQLWVGGIGIVAAAFLIIGLITYAHKNAENRVRYVTAPVIETTPKPKPKPKFTEAEADHWADVAQSAMAAFGSDATVLPGDDLKTLVIILSGKRAITLDDYTARKMAVMAQQSLGKDSTVIIQDDVGKRFSRADASGVTGR
jgi:hypothetical protein